MQIIREFIEFEDECYEVLRMVKITSNPIIDTWKEYLQADKVLKKNGYYIFCRLVENVEFEEILNNE